MKKTLLILASSCLMLAGCGAAQAGLVAPQAHELAATNTVYLVLSKIGTYSGAQPVREKVESKFLENVIEFSGNVGDALPGKDEVGSTSGAEFQSWVSYDGTGALTEYTTVPAQSGKILYAYFASNGGGTVNPGTSTPTEGDVTYTITGLPSWITDNGCVIFAWVWGNGENGAWVDCVYGEGEKPTSLSFTVSHEMTGCLLARCAEGTTAPSWNEGGDVPGRVYNQTQNIDLTSGTYSYPCGTWKEYKLK